MRRRGEIASVNSENSVNSGNSVNTHVNNNSGTGIDGALLIGSQPDQFVEPDRPLPSCLQVLQQYSGDAFTGVEEECDQEATQPASDLPRMKADWVADWMTSDCAYIFAKGFVVIPDTAKWFCSACSSHKFKSLSPRDKCSTSGVDHAYVIKRQRRSEFLNHGKHKKHRLLWALHCRSVANENTIPAAFNPADAVFASYFYNVYFLVVNELPVSLNAKLRSLCVEVHKMALTKSKSIYMNIEIIAAFAEVLRDHQDIRWINNDLLAGDTGDGAADIANLEQEALGEGLSTGRWDAQVRVF